ncbi:site-specific integrase [Bacillus thuringiensis]|uniref:site-specific integrase n=1 Tax=Bacillus thuringiensis TaxID=1428 RepID=UPI0009B54A38
MEVVNPIRSLKDLEDMKECLLMKSYRDFLLFVMGINTGLRIGDLLKLKVGDVKDKTHIRIREQKTKKNKQFPITHIKEEIDRYVANKNEEEWLFPSRKGDKPITKVQAYRILNNCADMVGLENIGTHSMRKTFGYHYYKKTKDVAYLMTIFNHASQEVTKRYIGITQDEIDASMQGFKL